MAGQVLAGPKTHTPGSRVKNLGHRFYSPGTGRFLNPDPLGDEAFLRQFIKGKTWKAQKRLRDQAHAPAYLFVRNTPIVMIDHLGLIFLPPWQPKYHGNWCGPGWTGGEPKDSGDYDWPNASTNVVGHLDNCCRKHDACYAGWDLEKGDWVKPKRPQSECDDDLCECSKGGSNPNSKAAHGIRCYFCRAKEDEPKGCCIRFVF
jgi:RHS repeat-associated protein